MVSTETADRKRVSAGRAATAADRAARTAREQARRDTAKADAALAAGPLPLTSASPIPSSFPRAAPPAAHKGLALRKLAVALLVLAGAHVGDVHKERAATAARNAGPSLVFAARAVVEPDAKTRNTKYHGTVRARAQHAHPIPPIPSHTRSPTRSCASTRPAARSARARSAPRTRSACAPCPRTSSTTSSRREEAAQGYRRAHERARPGGHYKGDVPRQDEGGDSVTGDARQEGEGVTGVIEEAGDAPRVRAACLCALLCALAFYRRRATRLARPSWREG